ncbi:MAG TPA: DsrH/TusB family sulfur metabolism protein [Nitrospiria bacterium]
MARYLIVDSRDLQEYSSGRYIQNLAGKLQGKGNDVTLFLIENGVLAARKGNEFGKGLTDLTKQGAKVFAEDVSCKARGISDMGDGISQANMDQLADLIIEGSDKVIWY